MRALPGVVLSSLLITSTRAQDFLFDRPICTGLGDRVGIMLSLAALARHHNASVRYLWCEDPSVIYPRIRSIGSSQPMKNDQTYFFSDIFLKTLLYYKIMILKL